MEGVWACFKPYPSSYMLVVRPNTKGFPEIMYFFEEPSVYVVLLAKGLDCRKKAPGVQPKGTGSGVVSSTRPPGSETWKPIRTASETRRAHVGIWLK